MASYDINENGATGIKRLGFGLMRLPKAGEAIDIVKKWLAQGHELDRAHLVRELGDVAWYLAEAATALDVPLEDVLQANLDKLQKRFPEGFNASASVHRNEQDQ